MFEVETIEAISDDYCAAVAAAAGLPLLPPKSYGKIREALKQVPKAEAICKALGVLPTGPRLQDLREVLGNG